MSFNKRFSEFLLFSIFDNKLTDTDAYVRYDDTKTIKTYLPENLKIIETRGTRMVLLSAFIMQITFISHQLKFTDKLLSGIAMKYVAGFMIVIAQKNP